ncbi:hypothetical protein SE15_12990 [Thermanaerothrix daxensis]|uniref:Ferritin n=1 Tax=Thermanaerothrix daxensis TaxID=869279 RepID=A0A0P6YI60_9CHLR|nr:ferritin [Thermanaerothrix daxensis]KPL82032.1 hypothetical protein SE15_12990 [Thermanaerothrix daxensis]
MALSKTLNEAINAQIGREFAASLQYTNLAAHFDSHAYPKLAAFFYKQAEEERDHALRFVKYVVEAGGSVAIPAVPAPQPSVASIEEAFRLSLDWEEEVTRQIHHLVDLAVAEKDYQTRHFLDWFVEEQLEEVNTMDTLLRIASRLGEQNSTLLELYLPELAEED